ncbi:MAG: hypothetical protein AB7V36_01095 [Bacteroidales bacterium]
MKKKIVLLISLLLLGTPYLQAQLEDGKHFYSNSNVQLEFVQEGNSISSGTVTIDGFIYPIIEGGFRLQNEYGWYEFSTDFCNYSFEFPSAVLVLEQSGCTVALPETKYTLTKAGAPSRANENSQGGKVIRGNSTSE